MVTLVTWVCVDTPKNEPRKVCMKSGVSQTGAAPVSSVRSKGYEDLLKRDHVVRMAMGGEHTVVLGSNGVYAWGSDEVEAF